MRDAEPAFSSLTLPGFAGTDDAAIVLGSDLPPCMQSTYTGAIIFRSQNTVSIPGIGGPVSYFIGKRIAGQVVDEGYVRWDQAGVCGFIVMKTRGSTNFSGLVQYNEINGAISEHGGLGFDTTPGIGGAIYTYVSQVGLPATRIQIGIASIPPSQTLFLIDGISVGRGIRDRVSSVANSAAIGAAETIVLTGNTITFYNGRCYNVIMESDITASVANATTIHLRQNNVAGAILGVANMLDPFGGTNFHTYYSVKVKRVAGTDLVDKLVQTILASGGTSTQTGATTQVRYMEIWDCGDAGDYSNAIAI